MSLLTTTFDQPLGAAVLEESPSAEGVAFSTGEHGFERMERTIPRLLIEAFRVYDQAGTLHGEVNSGAGDRVWEGRTEDPAIYANEDGSGLKLSSLGYWRALSDTLYTALWSTTSLSVWRTVNESDVSNRTPGMYAIEISSHIQIATMKGATYGSGANVGSVVFQAPHNGARQIIGFSIDYVGFLPTNWRFFYGRYSEGFVTLSGTAIVDGAGAAFSGSINVTISGCDYIELGIFNNTGANSTPAGETGANYVRITNLRLVTATANRINTTLTANRNAGVNVTATVGSTARMYNGQRLQIGGASESVVVLSIGSSTQFNADFAKNHLTGDAVQAHVIYADEIASDLVSTVSALNSTQLSSSPALIQSPGLDLTDEVYADVVPADVLTYLANLGDNASPPNVWEVGVWEDRRLHFRPRSSKSRTWYVDVTDLEVARSLEQLVNSIYATYEEAGGRTLRSAVSTDATSVNRYKVTRRKAINVRTTSLAAATAQRDLALSDTKDPIPRSRVRFTELFDGAGARWPGWMARSGDTLIIRNLPANLATTIDRIRSFRISRTDYRPDDEQPLGVELESPLPGLAFFLARQAAGVLARSAVVEESIEFGPREGPGWRHG